jgi:phospholipase/carboxylesterase
MSDLGFIHRFVPGSRQGLPTLLLLHGTGGNEEDLLDLGSFLAPGAALLSPRGKVLENGMPRFFRRIAEGVFDLEDLRLRVSELAGFIRAAAEAYSFDPLRVMAVGYSNGANVAAGLLLLRPGVLAGAALLHAMVPLVPDPLPDLGGVPVFLSGGQQDRMIPAAETGRLADLLSSTGASVQVALQPGGHGLSRPELDEAREWFSSLARVPRAG